MSQFLAELEPIFAGAQAGPANRWSACNFFDKVVFAQSSVAPLYWPKGGDARVLPGLPSGEAWDGVEEFAGHLILWRDEIIKWSDLNDFSTWLPVTSTAVSLRVETLEDFIQPGPSIPTDWIHVDEDAATFVVGQFVRVDLEENDPTSATYNFYTVSAVADPVGKTASTIPVSHVFPADGETYYAFTDLYTKWPTGGRLLDDGFKTMLEVTGSSRDQIGFFTSAAVSEAVPGTGGTFHITLNENPTDLRVGDVLSLGLNSGVGLDLYEVVTVAFTLELRRLNVGTTRQALNYHFPVGTFLTFQPFVRAKNTGTVSSTIAPGSVLTVQGAVKLIPQNLTGEVAEGTTIPEGSTIASVNANEAGEAPNAGGQINGPVFAVVTLGEYGVIVKERSIQSLQYVGRASGTFFARPEVLDEGVIARYAWSRISDNRLVFWGHKEIYEYSGGLNLVPIAQQHTQEVFKEVDLSRRDEIVVYHNERDSQVWFVYPTLTSEKLKVLIYNYREKTAVIDTYSNDLNGISALGAIDWEAAPAWQDLEDTQLWSGETKKWFEYVEDGLQRYTIIAIGGTPGDPNLGEDADATIPRLLLHGRQFSRAHADNCLPSAYYAYAETQDFDFKDTAAFKYVDTLQLEMEVPQQLERPMKMWVQIGSRANLDGDIKWSTPVSVEVSGNGTVTTKVNIRASGRYHRIRFFSNAVGAQWRIAGFALIARKGGTD
jgi:hypothetical protein